MIRLLRVVAPLTEKDEEIDDPPDHYKHLRDDRTCFRYVVDHHACEGDPYYNGGSDTAHDTESPGTATIPLPTTMEDNPACSIPEGVQDNISKVIYRFETCAICADTGKIMV